MSPDQSSVLKSGISATSTSGELTAAATR
jgi:hypothetical protein